MIDARGTISQIPMLRIAVVSGGGIFLGDALLGYVLPIEWLGVALIFCALGILTLRNKILSSVLIFLTVFSLGAMYIAFHESQEPTLPRGQRQYEGIIITEPIQKGKILKCDILVPESFKGVQRVPESFKGVQRVSKGLKIKASLFQVPSSSQSSGGTAGAKFHAPHIGTTIRWTGKLEKPREWKESHFSYIRWMRIHDYKATAFIGKGKWDIANTDLPGLSLWQKTKLRLLITRNDILKKMLETGISKESFGVIAAMTMGDKTHLSKEEKDTYSIAGASHILALSGMHIGIIMFLLTVIAGGRRHRKLQILAIATVWGYVAFVGLPISAIRSALMLTIWYALTLLRREQHPLNVLGATAFILLLINPETIFDVGFQMSFMAVFFILLCMPTLMAINPYQPAETYYGREDETWKHKVWKWLYTMVCISCVAQLGTIPLTMYYFGRLSCYFLLTNIIILPLATVLIYLTIILVIAILTDYGIGLISRIEDTMMTIMNTSIEHISSLPGASLEGINI